MKHSLQLSRHLSSSVYSLGLAVYDEKNGRSFGFNENQHFPLASVAKLIVAASALSSCNEPEPLREQVHRAISQHDREATTDLLAHAGGVDRVNQQLRLRGLAIRIHADQRNRTENTGTPQAMVRYLQDLVNGRIVPGAGLQMVLEALKCQEDPDSMFGRVSTAPALWLHMTGGFEGVCNDVGILELPSRRVLCCLFVTGDPQGDWSRLSAFMEDTGRLLYQSLGDH